MPVSCRNTQQQLRSHVDSSLTVETAICLHVDQSILLNLNLGRNHCHLQHRSCYSRLLLRSSVSEIPLAQKSTICQCAGRIFQLSLECKRHCHHLWHIWFHQAIRRQVPLFLHSSLACCTSYLCGMKSRWIQSYNPTANRYTVFLWNFLYLNSLIFLWKIWILSCSMATLPFSHHVW